MGGSIKLSQKESLESWYGDMSLSWLHNKPFFQGFDYFPYKVNISLDDAIYIFLSEYKSPNNLAYVLSKMKQIPEDPEGDDVYDFERPSKKFISEIEETKKIVQEEWNKEFSQEKLDSFKKPNIDWQHKLDEYIKTVDLDNVIEKFKQFHEYTLECGLEDYAFHGSIICEMKSNGHIHDFNYSFTKSHKRN